jgi:hypothetical protein
MSGPEVAAQRLSAEPALQAHDMIRLHRASYRNRWRARNRRLYWSSEITNCVIDRHDQRRELLCRNRMISDVARDYLGDRTKSGAS